MNITLDIKGEKALLKSLKDFGSQGSKAIASSVKINAQEIVLTAKTLAPKNLGRLAGDIARVEVDPYHQVIEARAPYAGYMEFGTGQRVSVPAEFQAMANKWKNQPKGSFDKGLESIKAYCRDKGIPEDAAFPIFMSILRNGLTPQPFMYPAYVKARKVFPEDLKQIIGDMIKKFNSK